MWFAEKNGIGIVQTIHFPQIGKIGIGQLHQTSQKIGRTRSARSLGHLGRRDSRTSNHVEPCTYLAPFGYSSVWADFDWRQSHSIAPTRLCGIQCRLRRWPNGRTRTIVFGSTRRSPYFDVGFKQRVVSSQWWADHRTFSRHRFGLVLHDARQNQR